MKNCCTKTRVVIENRQHVSHGLARVNAKHAPTDAGALRDHSSEHFTLSVEAVLEPFGTIQSHLTDSRYVLDLLNQSVELSVTLMDDFRMQSRRNEHIFMTAKHFASGGKCTGAGGDQPGEHVPLHRLREDLPC